MRFLFVYETAAGKARDLLSELLVTDVRIIVARKGELEPRPEELLLLEKNRGAEAAACELNRKYRKNVLPLVRFTVEPKKFRVEDQQLRAWLLGGDEIDAEGAQQRPKNAFDQAAAASPTLLVHPAALGSADLLDEARWAFAAKSAALLGQHASGAGELGPLRLWEAAHGVAFAANGRVTYSYSIEVGGDRWTGSSEWHLKAGDSTTAERAARVYFATATLAGVTLILVAYVGPHPADGAYTADFGTVEFGA